MDIYPSQGSHTSLIDGQSSSCNRTESQQALESKITLEFASKDVHEKESEGDMSSPSVLEGLNMDPNQKVCSIRFFYDLPLTVDA